MLLRYVKYRNDYNDIRRQVQAQVHAQRYHRRDNGFHIRQQYNTVLLIRLSHGNANE
jgi:hypothetical protein